MKWIKARECQVCLTADGIPIAVVSATAGPSWAISVALGNSGYWHSDISFAGFGHARSMAETIYRRHLAGVQAVTNECLVADTGGYDDVEDDQWAVATNRAAAESERNRKSRSHGDACGCILCHKSDSKGVSDHG